MLLDDDLEETVKLIIMEIMMILYKNDITEVHVGALMRLIGVDEETARDSDNERIQIDEKFSKYVKQMINLSEEDDSDHTHTLH